MVAAKNPLHGDLYSGTAQICIQLGWQYSYGIRNSWKVK